MTIEKRRIFAERMGCPIIQQQRLLIATTATNTTTTLQ